MAGCKDSQRAPGTPRGTIAPIGVAAADDSTQLEYNRVRRDEVGGGASHGTRSYANRPAGAAHASGRASDG